MVARTAFLAALALALALASPAQAAAVVHASADDCTIIVAVGKAEIGWGSMAPDYDFFPVFNLRGGGTYIEDCAWAAYGVGAPRIATAPSEKGFFISRPKYSDDTASADFEVRLQRKPGAEGQPAAPFIKEDRCTFRKRDGAWQLVACEMLGIT